MTKIYRLARNSAYAVNPFGPLMTLEQAEGYQADMARAGFPVLIVNTMEGQTL